MTTLPAELEALMPEPVAFARKWHADGETPAKVDGKWPAKFKMLPVTKGQCFVDDMPLFTADQMREAILAATERAAKLCDEQAEFHQDMHNSQAEQAADACAVAIRARTGGGQT